MININDITTAIKALFSSSTVFSDYQIEIGEPVNMSMGVDWLGIYRDKIVFDPKYLGAGANNWLADVTVRIVLQDFNLDDKEKGLADKVKNAMIVLESDRKIGGTVDMVTGYEVEFSFVDSDDQSFYFQMATITLSLKVRT